MHNSFRKRGQKPMKYPEKPFQIFPKTEREKQIEAEREREKAVRTLKAWQSSLVKKYGSNDRRS